ncbi:hypothetical protein CGRA01v4_11972 [Colletotrichum graminicola]|nr:hypothetical protein CGRA01v4_11972 [Colletotrichum graminicola]
MRRCGMPLYCLRPNAMAKSMMRIRAMMHTCLPRTDVPDRWECEPLGRQGANPLETSSLPETARRKGVAG